TGEPHHVGGAVGDDPLRGGEVEDAAGHDHGYRDRAPDHGRVGDVHTDRRRRRRHVRPQWAAPPGVRAATDVDIRDDAPRDAARDLGDIAGGEPAFLATADPDADRQVTDGVMETVEQVEQEAHPVLEAAAVLVG